MIKKMPILILKTKLEERVPSKLEREIIGALPFWTTAAKKLELVMGNVTTTSWRASDHRDNLCRMTCLFTLRWSLILLYMVAVVQCTRYRITWEAILALYQLRLNFICWASYLSRLAIITIWTVSYLGRRLSYLLLEFGGEKGCIKWQFQFF